MDVGSKIPLGCPRQKWANKVKNYNSMLNNEKRDIC